MKTPDLSNLTDAMNGRLREMFTGRSGPLILPGQDRRTHRKGQRVRNLSGKPLPCCWKDCWRPGMTDHAVFVKHDAPERHGDMLTYIFCSESHREHWLNTLEPERRHLVVNAQRERSPFGLIIP